MKVQQADGVNESNRNNAPNDEERQVDEMMNRVATENRDSFLGRSQGIVDAYSPAKSMKDSEGVYSARKAKRSSRKGAREGRFIERL